MLSGPIIAMVWEGEGVVASARSICPESRSKDVINCTGMLGSTFAVDATPGTIRGDFAQVASSISFLTNSGCRGECLPCQRFRDERK